MDAALKVTEQQVASCLDNRVLKLIILPTEKCNFRCTYCYEDFLIGKMPERVITAVERLVDRRIPTLKLLQLSWFGGEPLAAKDVLLRIARHAFDSTQRHGVAFSGGMTTNGSLLNARLLKALYEVRHREYQITLDGDQPQHDTTRVKANGTGTFDQIWNNLCAARDFDGDVRVMLRLHVTGQNTDSLLRLLEKCDRELLPSNKFSIHFHRVSNLGGPGGKSVPPLNWEQYKELLKKLQPSTALQSSSEVALSEQGDICYAAKPNSLLVRADGRIGKCTVAMNDPRNDVGILHDDGTLTFNDRRLQLWFEGFADMNAKVLGCPLGTLGHETPLKETKPARAHRGIELALA